MLIDVSNSRTSLTDWEENLKTVAELAPEHISAYSLIVEEGTPFYEEYGRASCRRIT